MDAFTAGTALGVSKICVAVVMVFIWHVMPNEKCTRHWALGAVLVAAGVLASVLNAGAPRYAILILGNGAIVLGMIMQWRGIRVFYGKSHGFLGWVIGALFLALYLRLLVIDAPIPDRVSLISSTILAMLVLAVYEFMSGQRPHHTFASKLTIGSALFLALCYSVNVISVNSSMAEFTHRSTSPLAVSLIFLVPIAGTLLLTTGMLLLLFERMVSDKQYLATHDELTLLQNRRAIVAGGEREMAIAKRTGQALSVAYIDVDNFKNINDTLGHKAGDGVLVEIAKIILHTCRSTDLVGRYGGEEFCVVLPGVGHEGATIFGERLLRALREHRFINGNAVTASIGLATWDGASADPSWENLMSRADHALYKAKAAGRDRFFVSDEVEYGSLALPQIG